jgi:phosphatidate cytidylyltransferase
MASANVATAWYCKTKMFLRRTLFTITALPVGLFFVFVGEWPYFLFIGAILLRAAWEYARLFRSGGHHVPNWLVMGGVFAIALARFVASGFDNDHWVLALLCAVTLVIHLADYERGRDQAGTDFVASLSGIVYLGLLGSYLITVHQLERGEWWLVLSLFAVMLADTIAYIWGSRFGKNRMVPRLSPKKSWEGFTAGLLAATLGTPAFALLFRVFGMPNTQEFSLLNIGILGFMIGIFPTLGDLGISMFKREMNIKDTGTIIPGHGGFLDRMDSWLWAFPIGYYLVTVFFTS